MSTKHDPASVQYTVAAQDDPADYCIVLEQQGTDAVVSNLQGNLKVGTFIEFQSLTDVISGVVISLGVRINSPVAYVSLSTALPVRKGKLKKVLATSPDPFWYNPSMKQYGALEVVCKAFEGYGRGKLSWTLSYIAAGSSEIELIKGHDYLSPGVCQVFGTGTWTPGIYHLKVALLDDSFQVIRIKSCRWEPDQRVEKLTRGRLNDNLPPLMFSY